MSATWKLVLLLVAIIMLSIGTCRVFAEGQNLGRVRIASFVCPRQVTPGSAFSVNLDIEYEVRTNATIRGVITESKANASTTLWESDITSVSGGGDKVWTVNFTAPLTEGTIQLSAYAYYLDNGRWKFYNDTVLGPGFGQAVIKVARNATLQVELGVPEVEFTLGTLSETTTRSGGVGVTLAVGKTYSLSVPFILEYENSTRIIFNGWQDGSSQTNRTISIDGDTELVGSYRTQYLLQVTSNLPNHAYQKWYDAGSNVTLHEVDSAPMIWPLGLLGGKYVFSGWSGEVNSGSAEVSFTMNSPTTIHAQFSIAYSPLIVFPIFVATGIIGGLILFTLRRKKATQVEAESSSSMSKCSNCGSTVEEGWAHCIHCGTKLNRLENQPEA